MSGHETSNPNVTSPVQMGGFPFGGCVDLAHNSAQQGKKDRVEQRSKSGGGGAGEGAQAKIDKAKGRWSRREGLQTVGEQGREVEGAL